MRTVVTLGACTALATALGLAGCSKAEAADPLAGTAWELLNIQSMAPEEQPDTTIDDPSAYTVEFGGDGQAAFRIDCNRGSSTWTSVPAAADSGSLTFGPIALTRMACQQPTADAEVAAALGRVRSYLLSDGQLHLSTEADGGILHWRPQA